MFQVYLEEELYCELYFTLLILFRIGKENLVFAREDHVVRVDRRDKKTHNIERGIKNPTGTEIMPNFGDILTE